MLSDYSVEFALGLLGFYNHVIVDFRCWALPHKVDLCTCNLGVPVLFCSLAFPNYFLLFDLFLIGDIYINYGTPLLEFETSNDCLAEKAVHLLMQQSCESGSPVVS